MSYERIDEIVLDPARARVYEEGWQSWSPTTWYPAGATSSRPEHTWQHEMRFRPGVSMPEVGFQGEGLLAIDPGDGGPTRVYGGAGPSVPSIRAQLEKDRLIISAIGSVRRWDVEATGPAALVPFADEVADQRGVSLRETPQVWCSWYRYFEDVTESDVVENLEGMTAAHLPVDVVQIDDGWQAAVGDWTTSSGRFGPLSALADRIAATGRRAGIWLAPFTVSARSALASEHPQWCVGSAGKNWGGPLAGLDMTHPMAREYLWAALRELRDAGFSFFKLDFLYSGAVPGRRHQDASGEDAYRSGLELVRDAVGPDAYLVGCGAPILPSVGAVDAMRVSPDTFHEGQQDGSVGLRGEAGVRARTWQHGRFWANDADCLVVRPSYPLRAELAKLIEECGGMRSISDRLGDLDSWGLRAIRRSLDTAPGITPIVPAPTVKESLG